MPAPSTCFLCGKSDYKYWSTSTDVEYYSTADDYEYYECQNCKLLQISPVPVDKLYAIYPSNYYSFVANKKTVVDNIKEWMDKNLFKKLLRDLKGNIKVLDVGGGSGWLLNVIKSITDRVAFTQVVDLDKNAEQLAKQNGHEYFCGKIEDFETDQKFDLILMLNLIEHVEDPLVIMQKIEKLLTDQGILLIKTPNYDSLDARVFKRWGGLHCPRHWVLFNKESFNKLAEKANLKIKSLSYTQGAPFWTVSVLTILKKWGWVKISAERPAIYHPLFPVFLGIFAGFDLLRKPFAKTSQMFVILSK
jgi:2-polyprenyl-3-methyl-5-hydroxy-6-metoxy-1,4-benzoquinol methylase